MQGEIVSPDSGIGKICGGVAMLFWGTDPRTLHLHKCLPEQHTKIENALVSAVHGKTAANDEEN